MKTFKYETEGLLINNGKETTTRIIVVYMVDERGRSSFTLADKVSRNAIIITGNSFLQALDSWDIESLKLYSGSLYGKNCYEANNRQEPDKERK